MQIQKEDTDKKRKDGMIEAWFVIEAMGMTREVVESSLNNHYSNLESENGIYVYEKHFSEIKAVDVEGKEAYSQLVDVKLFAKDLITLMSVVLLYGPSAVEVLGPKKKEIEIVDLYPNKQYGQFASAGAGGIVIAPDKKRRAE